MSTKLGLVHCRICKQDIDRNIQKENIDWIQPSKGWYYHPQCYSDFAKKKKGLCNDIHAEVDNDLWFSALYDYLQKDLKMSLNMAKTKSQWNNFIKKGYTAKGIYFAIRYFYEIQHGDPSKSDGIGIITCIYNEGCQYWVDRENKDSGICERIEKQIKIAANQKQIIITQKIKDNKKVAIDLSSIANMEDEDDC